MKVKMEKSEILRSLFSRTASGIKLGLERMSAAAEELGSPHKKFKTVHVAGTNGKGSVCTLLDAALRAEGIALGLYTSPHLINFNERFRINGEAVSDKKWIKSYENIISVIEKYDLTFFEASTLLAFNLFAEEKVEYAVIETGLGGRLDATNIVSPEVSVITKIGIDHTAYLGDNILSIAKEKLGIIKKNTPVIMLKPEEVSIITKAQAVAKKLNSPLEFIEDKNYSINLKMVGDFQKQNLAVVIRTLEILNIEIDKNHQNALSKVRLSGRFDVRKINGKKVIFDVSHNPQAVDTLLSTLKCNGDAGKILIVAGLMKDKDTKLIVTKYCDVAKSIIFTRPDTERSESPAKLKEFADPFHLPVETCDLVNHAVDLAFKKAADSILITGSFFTVGEAMGHLKIKV